MRLRQVSLKGITRFREPVRIDFAALPEGLIALAGPNGAGKSTLLEAPYATLYGEMATRPGSLYGVATGRDATLEMSFENGAGYRALVSVDAIANRAEAYLFAEDGTPITDGKMRSYAAEVEKRFGSAKLMLAAALSAQNHRGSFLELSKADRKDLLCSVLDVAGLQCLSEAARAKVKAGELQLERLRGQLAEAEAELARIATTVSIEDLQVERARLEAEITTAQADLEVARERYADLQTRHALALEAEKQRAAKMREAATIAGQIGDLEGKLAGIPKERERAEDRAGAAILEAEDAAARLPEYRAAADSLPAAKTRRAEAQGDLRERNTELREAREILLGKTRETGKAAAIRTRLSAAQRQAELLGEVPCTDAEVWTREGAIADGAVSETVPLSALCPLLADARIAQGAIEGLQADLLCVEALEAGLPEYQHAVDHAEAAVRAAQAALNEAQEGTERLEPLAAGMAAAEAAVKRAAEVRQALEETLTSLSAREQEYQTQIDTLKAKRSDLLHEVAGMEGDVEAANLDSEMKDAAQQGTALKSRVAEFQDQLQDIVRAIAQAEAEAKRRTELEERTTDARAAADQLAGELGEWGILERAFGRDGIQALEIDAAGPELSALTNELLTSCFGPRFELRFVTQAPKASEKGAMKEVFDVQVIDHDRGREGAVDSLSGGEKTVVSEAISLALAIYVGRHSGRRYETLFRDETAGQLDPDNAQRYVAMLRRARVMAGAHQVVFIAQQPEVWQAADAVLYLQDGKVEVRT
jgi:DNA repair protein SbcC/Rad50